MDLQKLTFFTEGNTFTGSASKDLAAGLLWPAGAAFSALPVSWRGATANPLFLRMVSSPMPSASFTLPYYGYRQDGRER